MQSPWFLFGDNKEAINLDMVGYISEGNEGHWELFTPGYYDPFIVGPEDVPALREALRRLSINKAMQDEDNYRAALRKQRQRQYAGVDGFPILIDGAPAGGEE